MASKHLKKTEREPGQPEKQGKHSLSPDGPGWDDPEEPEQLRGRHAAPESRSDPEYGREPELDLDPEYDPDFASDVPDLEQAPSGGRRTEGRKTKDKKRKDKKVPAQGSPKSDADEQTVQAVVQALGGGGKKPVLVPAPYAPSEKAPVILKKSGAQPDRKAPDETQAPEKKEKVTFRRARAKRSPDEAKKPLLSHRDAVGAVISLIAAAVLLAAAVVIWFYRDSFSPDALIYSADTTAVAQDEYLFDAGSGEAFAAAGRGLAVANTAGLELLDGSGTPVTSMVMQMENPTAAGCADFALFYDLGGQRMALARFDGSVEELDVAGDILSATVSVGGYIAVTTESTGFRALVTVYDPSLETIYRWYSSSAWVMSANVSPDGRKLAVLSYTATGSEIRFFDLDSEEQQGAFPISGTILLDMHWFTSNQLCAVSSDQALFFNAGGEWQNTYGFSGQYLIGYTFDGGNCAALALSPYRAGTTAKLVSLDSSGNELGTADIQSELVCLTANDLEIMALCSDGAVLYNSSLSEKGRLSGLTGFKYGLLRARGEALLIASNYAEVYTF